jgi:microcystin degradation protein MlrC
MRVLIGGIAHETDTFNPIPTSIGSFKVIRSDELLNEEPARTLISNGVEVLPTIYAYTLPSGMVDEQAYTLLKDELIEKTRRAGGIDGFCLTLHGAMVVEGVGSAELDLVKTLREVIGEDVIISASLDLHGNISEEIAEYADILTAYRTTPHLDVTDTRKRAANILVQSIKRDKRPKTVIVKPPVLARAMLEELISSEVEDAVIGCILDRESVEACRIAGTGASLKLEIGGKLDKVNGHPLEVRGRVLKLTKEGAVFRVGGVDVIMTTERTAFTSPEDFMAYGIDPLMREIVVVKLGLLTASARYDLLPFGIVVQVPEPSELLVLQKRY